MLKCSSLICWFSWSLWKSLLLKVNWWEIINNVKVGIWSYFMLVDVTNHPNWKLLEHETCGISLGAFSTDRIVGGVNASLGAYPWIARLGYKNSSSSAQISFRCGGVLISHFYVITAAHCTVNLPDGSVLPELDLYFVRPSKFFILKLSYYFKGFLFVFS